jgi:mono/diheme cytochrome c family protein
MARRNTEIDEEKKSRSVLFLLASLALLVTGVWAVWNDNISRRPWKLFQYEFRNLEYKRAQDAMAAEDARLQTDPQYRELQTQLVAARQSLAAGETAKQIAERHTRLAELEKRLAVVDLDLRFVKSELEEAWYELDHAREFHQPEEPRRARIDKLEAHRVDTKKAYDDLTHQKEQFESEIKELQAGVKTIEDKITDAAAERTKLEQKVEGLVVLHVGPVKMLQVPRIEQAVLEEFDRNAYNQPIARVDRCVSCHVGIDKPGFEDQPNPFKTHPDRERILAKHPPDKFGCTPCHDGQGASVNSVAQAHGDVPFWEYPLLRGEKVQARCNKCHTDVGSVDHADHIATGQKLFENLGCTGCHLVEGFEDLPKVGPYLRRIGAKVDPSWLTRWVTNPHQFRPSTKMPNILFAPEQGTAVAAYLLQASAKESQEWLAQSPEPTGINAKNAALVARGQEITQQIGCRGCHAFAPGEHGPRLGSGTDETASGSGVQEAAGEGGGHQAASDSGVQQVAHDTTVHGGGEGGGAAPPAADGSGPRTSKDIAPNLANIAEKTNGRWIFHWLKNPRHFSPVSRMPSLRLTDEDAAAVTSYLLTLGAPKPEPAERLAALSRPETIADGEKLVRKYGCAGCHDVPGMENESRIGVELSAFGGKTVEELFFGERYDIPRTWDDWTLNKIRTPRTYATERIEQVMPQFDLPDADIKELKVFLASRNEHVVPMKYRYKPNDPGQKHIVEGERLIAKYNCTGCHQIEGKGGFIRTYYQENLSLAPPILLGEGAKVQPDWLFSFLKGPVPIRPWLKVRMPTFNFSDEETNTLVDYFTARARKDIPFVYVDAGAIPAENIAAAKQLMSVDYFNCFSCHVQGDKNPEGPPEGWAPNLAMAKHRLNPDWIIQWIHDPQKVQPGTRMPSFYPGGPDDIFGGDEEQQIRAIRDYLMVLGLPEGGRVGTQVAQQPGAAEAAH